MVVDNTGQQQKKLGTCTSSQADLTRHLLFVAAAFGLILLVRTTHVWWLRILAVHVYALLQIRSFSILHDCAHNSYTPCQRTNERIGWGMSLLTHRFFPGYKLRHLIHHQTNGLRHNPHGFPFNETVFHTVAQYRAMSAPQRALYRFWRGPPFNLGVLLFGFVKFAVAEHFSFLRCRQYAATQLLAAQLCFSAGSVGVFALFAHLGLLYEYILNLNVIAWLAFALVHNEHTFNPPYIVDGAKEKETKKWSYRDSGLKGSSYIQIPPGLGLFKYLFMGLEYHNFHHMNAHIPGYHLQQFAETHAPLTSEVVKLSLTDCWHNLWLVLYDEDSRTYKTFAEAEAATKKF
jgi:omega-6 fatty acid desaturase (delta-12 desaturase)